MGTTNISTLATVEEPQQHEERQPKSQQSFDDHYGEGNAHSGQVLDLTLASGIDTDFRRSESIKRRATKSMNPQSISGYIQSSEVADSVAKSRPSRLNTAVGRPSIIPLQQAAKAYPDTNSSVSSLDAMWDLNDEAMTVSSSGSSNPEEYTLSNDKTDSNVQLTSVSNVAMIPAVRDSRDMTGVASQLTNEWVAKEAFRMQPPDTPLDGIVSGSPDGIVSEQQTPFMPRKGIDAPLTRARKIGRCSHASGHEDTEKPHNALEGQMSTEEAAFHSAVFHLGRREYREARRVLRPLPRIHKNGDSDYKAKLYLLLAKAYQGQGQLEKAKGFASVSLDERQDLHGETHHLVEESAKLLIAILIGLGNNLEADALRKVHCPRRSYTAVSFELHPSNLVDVRKVPDMPPESRKDEYLYQPHDLIPPTGENLMAHLFHYPHEANERAITFMRSPKKRKLRLAICPQMGTNIGWGIHLVEGWSMIKLWLLALVISFLGGMVFAVTWSVMKHDIQGAFAVAAYFVALSGLGAGTAQAYLN
ncbi:MAG: hypothetical protein Q9222_004020 [Ikaeria aurantiellina]